MIAKGHEVLSYIIDRGYGNVGDFFKVDFPNGVYDIVSNPPYDSSLSDIVVRCLDICKDRVALLMPMRYLSGKGRYETINKNFPPQKVYVYKERVLIAKNGDFEKYSDAGANLEIYAWYVWQKGHNGPTELRWIDNGE